MKEKKLISVAIDIEVKKLRLLGNHKKSRVELMMKGTWSKETERMVVRMGEVESKLKSGEMVTNER